MSSNMLKQNIALNLPKKSGSGYCMNIKLKEDHLNLLIIHYLLLKIATKSICLLH